MAKLTKKIRTVGYDVLKNEFHISFKLADITADHLSFVSTYTYPGRYGFAGSGEQELEMLGLDADHIQQIVEEIFNWMEKPRKALGSLSHGYTMRSRFDATKRLEVERRGKHAAERIIAEAPPLDWAMSVLDELVDEPAVVGGADDSRLIHINIQTYGHAKALDDLLSADTRSEAAAKFIRAHFTKDLNSICDRDLRIGRDTVREVAEATRDMLINPVQEMEELAASLTDGFISRQKNAERLGVDIGNIYPRVSRELRRIEARVSAMEAAGLGEEPVCVSDPVDLQQQHEDAEEAKYQYRRKIAEDRTEKAVNSIHNHVRRFMAPASIREHDFLRSIIQQEIEKVVEGVL